jgi:DNA-binding response OmpR family regulator/DNA-binding CsgD family transcriptional regulator
MTTILIVDDQPEYLKACASYFFEEDMPYKIISATNGKMAIDIAGKENPDIIIMDWQMPVMDGLTALKELKKDSNLCDIPVIMATGIMLGNDDLKLALEAGASDYIRKPIDKTELLARTNSHIKMAEYIKTIKNKDLIIDEERNERINVMAESVQSVSLQMQEMIKFFENERREIMAEIIEIQQSKKNNNEVIDRIYQKLLQNQKIFNHYLSVSELYNQEEGYIKKLLILHPGLLPAEIELCLFLKKNLSSKEIAMLTFKSPNTVKVARSRLRKKLGIDDKKNLYTYLNSI